MRYHKRWSDYEHAMVRYYAAWYAWCLDWEEPNEIELAALAYQHYMDYLEKKYTHELA